MRRRRVVRSNNRTPKRASSNATWRVAVAFEMSSRAAAREKLPSSATWAKTYMLLRMSIHFLYTK